ncbi:MAG: hypothetical protein FD129_1160 [bacterium]|nr:MAG: hypothetical protein FD129_1160 [bacterium]
MIRKPVPVRTVRPGRAAWVGGGFLLVSLLLGCSDAPRVAPGCYLNGAVPGATRRAIEKAADTFYEQLRSHEYEAAYLESAAQLRERVAKQQVALAWTSIAEILTLPATLATEEIALVSVAKGERGPRELTCLDPADTSNTRRMMATDQPLQVYLIQSGLVGGTLYNFASVWFFDEGKWRIATFGTKPRTVADHDWAWWRTMPGTRRSSTTWPWISWCRRPGCGRTP